METLGTFLLSLDLKSACYNIKYWNELHCLGLSLIEENSLIAVWITGNCLIAARLIDNSRTDLLIVATKRQDGYAPGQKVHADEQARNSWHSLGMQIVRIGWASGFPGVLSVPGQLISPRILPFLNSNPDEAVWKANQRRESGVPFVIRTSDRDRNTPKMTDDELELQWIDNEWKKEMEVIEEAREKVRKYEDEHQDVEPTVAAKELANRVREAARPNAQEMMERFLANRSARVIPGTKYIAIANPTIGHAAHWPPEGQQLPSGNKVAVTKSKNKRDRGVSIDIQYKCKKAMEIWLDQKKPLQQAADLAMCDDETILKHIPAVLKTVDPKTRERWDAEIKALGKEKYLTKSLTERT